MSASFLFRLIFNRFFFYRLAAYALLIAVLWLFQSFFLVFLITFLFSSLFLDLARSLRQSLLRMIQNRFGKKTREQVTPFLWANVIVTALYIVFIVVITVVVSTLIPKLVDETSRLVERTPDIVEQTKNALLGIEAYTQVDLGIREALENFFNKDTIQGFAEAVFENLKNIGLVLFQILVALVLSYVFIMDRQSISEYLSLVRRSNFSFFYDEYAALFEKIEKGFGLIFKAQALVALINACITAVGLFLIGIFTGSGEGFPYVLTLSTIVFVMGFVPVLGTILSSVPMLLIGYTYGDLPATFAVLGLIAFVHAVEAYYLNPKIVSSYMEFPVFITFVVLLVSEHLFGLIGLLVGVPLYYILTDVAHDLDRYIGKIITAHREAWALQEETRRSIDGDIRLSRSRKRGEK